MTAGAIAIGCVGRHKEGGTGWNLASRREAVEAGAKLIKPGQKLFWGGYSGNFADPDGFLWEVAWNPEFWVE